ncbi:MAG: hypothetical protein ACXVPC_01650, partial [Tumebacillaceae bacterium]
LMCERFERVVYYESMNNSELLQLCNNGCEKWFRFCTLRNILYQTQKSMDRKKGDFSDDE